MTADEEEQRLQLMVGQIRVLEAYLNEISARESLTGRAIMESRASLEAVEALAPSPTSDVLFPIGSGVFVSSQVVRPEKLLVDVGAGAVVEKTPQETSSFVDERIKELGAGLRTLQSQKAELANQIATYKSAVSDIVEKARKGL